MALLLPAELAWYATGRFYETDAGQLADYGYFLHLPFPGVPLFAGPRGETTAHFTFAATPFQARTVENGALKLGLDLIGEFSIHLQRQPAGSFDDPASFAQGERIATFRRTSVVTGTTVETAAGQGLFGANVFSARLISSEAFEFGGGRHDLAEHIGRGVTQFGTSAAAPISPVPKGYAAVLAFTGSAVALG